MAENVGAIVWTAEMQTAQLVSAEKQISNSLAKTESSFVAAGKSAQVMNTQMTKTASAVNQASSSMGNLRGIAGNLGFQLQDIAVQAQMGASAFIILGQQGSQLASAFGPSGAVIGAVIAVSAAIGGVLFTSLSKTTEEIREEFLPSVEDMREKLDELSKSQAELAIIQVKKELEPLGGIAATAGARIEYLKKQIEKYPSNKDVMQWNEELETQEALLDGVNQKIIKLNEDQTAFNGIIKRNIEGTQGQQKADEARLSSLQQLIKAVQSQAAIVGLTERGIALYTAEQMKATEADIKAINAAYDAIDAENARQKAIDKSAQETANQKRELESAKNSWDNLSDSIAKQSATAQGAAAANQYQVEQIQLAGQAAGKTAEEIQKLVDAQNALFAAQEANRNAKSEEKRGNRVAEIEQEIYLQQIRNQLGNEQFEIESAIRALGPDSTPEEQQAIADKVTQLQALRFEYELLGATIQESMQGVALNALDNFSSGLARVITEGDSAREMFGNLAKTIATELLTAIIRYWVGQAAAALVGQTAVTAATVTAGGAAAAAWAPAATLASIATLGQAATVGVAALGTGLTAGIGLAAAAQTGGALAMGPGRLNGGPVYPGMMHPVTENGDPELYTMQGQSFLLPGSRGGEVTSFKDMQKMGVGGGGQTVVNVINNSTNTQVQETRRQRSDKSEVIDIVVSDLQNRGKIHKAIGSTTNAVNRTS